MCRCLATLLVCASLFAQDPRDLYRRHCSACHGPSGEGSRGPALRVPALQRANDPESVVALLRRGVPGTEMPPTAPQVIADEPLRALAGYVLSLRTESRAASSPGTRGAELFRGKGKCLECHRVNGEGRASGPDLSDVGRLRDQQWIRRAILEPEAAIYDSFTNYRWTILIPDNYLQVSVTTAAGERLIGSRLNEDPFSIQIRDSTGRIRSFLKSELTAIDRNWGKSPMPSYRQILSSSEVDDLVTYLTGLRGLR